MKVHDYILLIRNERIAIGQPPVPETFQGVTKEKIKEVLNRLDLGSNVELIDGVFALLDDQIKSLFPKAPDTLKFSDGAATAHLACHIGILQRSSGKLDREGRDYWIKPLRELGAIEPILFNKGTFIYGHVVPKSPNSSYRLSSEFKAILQAPDDEWERKLNKWITADALRRRIEFQAQMAEASRQLVDTSHSDLINACVEYYVPRFLADYKVIYIDDGDGDRITEDDKIKLLSAGLTLILGDAMPDVLLWNPKNDHLWVIEAVTSDGEVDQHKVNQLKKLATRCNKAEIFFTTAYRTWKDAASRQKSNKNLAAGTYMWIQEDAGKHFLAQTFTMD